MPEDYKTSKRITFATDSWGNDPKVTHLELKWLGQPLMVTITDDKISIIGPIFNVNVHSVNALEITPPKRQ